MIPGDGHTAALVKTKKSGQLRKLMVKQGTHDSEIRDTGMKF
jgi:hypothetical protein